MPPLTVAVTGPTGEVGGSLIDALEASEAVDAVRGMARRQFDPAAAGWRKATYQRGDILDRGHLAELFDGADVAVHLAFAIFGDREETRRINLEGSRNVFEAAVEAGVGRLVYASSVAAYGFHRENPQPLTEELPARGTASHYYSAQKAEVEAMLEQVLGDASGTTSRPLLRGGSRKWFVCAPMLPRMTFAPPGESSTLATSPAVATVTAEDALVFACVRSSIASSTLRQVCSVRRRSQIRPSASRGIAAATGRWRAR